MNNKIVIWIKIGQLFINQENIRGIVRYGKATKIYQIVGKDLIVNVGFDKLKKILPTTSIS